MINDEKILDVLAYLLRVNKVSPKVLFNLTKKIEKLDYSNNIKDPIIYFCDEYIAKKFPDNNLPKLQESILNCNNGGDRFFKLLEQELVNNSDVLVYKLYLLLLRNDFRGRYAEDELKILDYINKLSEIIEKKYANISDILDHNKPKITDNYQKLNSILTIIDDSSWRQYFAGLFAIYFSSCLLFYKIFS